VVDLPEVADGSELAERIRETARRHDLLRVKGFASVVGRPMRLVLQAVGPRVDSYFDRPFGPAEPRATRLVVIGMAGIDRAGVAAALGA